MNIYTRYGDRGFTRLVGGGRAKKNAPRVQAYGSIDTLNAQVGLTVASLAQKDSLYEELVQIQQWSLFGWKKKLIFIGRNPQKLIGLYYQAGRSRPQIYIFVVVLPERLNEMQ